MFSSLLSGGIFAYLFNQLSINSSEICFFLTVTIGFSALVKITQFGLLKRTAFAIILDYRKIVRRSKLIFFEEWGNWVVAISSLIEGAQASGKVSFEAFAIHES